tara:strand:+ start:26387 stop:26929 length:543 start_codon:yes stop_codon:yes gene_type:complete
MKKLRNVTISERAFVDIIASCIEVYKKETYGFLIGEKHKKHYMIYDAISFQSAKRGYESVNVSTFRINRMNYVFSHLTNLKLVGDFHSHPDFPDKLSETDKKDTKNSGLTLTLLIIPKQTKKKRHPWKIEDNNLLGFVGNKYYVKIMAFEYDRKKNKLFQIKIVCPSLKKLNKLKTFKKK